jgi:hypothetical protein
LFDEVLHASGPAAEYEGEMRTFARLIGSWDLDVTWFEDGEVRRRASGEWHFGFVLEGRAIQDVWIVPSRRDRARGAQPYEYGTSIRFYDPSITAWRSTWMGPRRGVVLQLLAREIGEEIVLEGRDAEGNALRWIFGGICADSFSWRNEIACPGGPFAVTQTFRAKRVIAPQTDVEPTS